MDKQLVDVVVVVEKVSESRGIGVGYQWPRKIEGTCGDINIAG